MRKPASEDARIKPSTKGLSVQARPGSELRTANSELALPSSWSCTPAIAISARRLDPAIAIETFSTGWQALLARSQKLRLLTAQLAVPRPGVVSIPIGAQGVKTI